MNEQNLKKFVKAILDACDFGTETFGDLDALTLQSLLVEHEVVKVEIRHKPCGEGCICAAYVSGEDWEDGVECFQLADWMREENTIYIRPNISQKMRYDAEKSARELMNRYGFNNVGKIISALAVENMRLVAEINEHRAARGIDPLPTFEV